MWKVSISNHPGWMSPQACGDCSSLGRARKMVAYLDKSVQTKKDSLHAEGTIHRTGIHGPAKHFSFQKLCNLIRVRLASELSYVFGEVRSLFDHEKSRATDIFVGAATDRKKRRGSSKCNRQRSMKSRPCPAIATGRLMFVYPHRRRKVPCRIERYAPWKFLGVAHVVCVFFDRSPRGKARHIC